MSDIYELHQNVTYSDKQEHELTEFRHARMNKSLLITKFERQLMALIDTLINTGYKEPMTKEQRKKYLFPTVRLPGLTLRFDVEPEFPVLKSRYVAVKAGLKEILWIYKDQSNNTCDLKDDIWDKFVDENGSADASPGYQIKRPVSIYTDPVNRTGFKSYNNQAEYVLEYLRENKEGKFEVNTFWNPEELSRMPIIPPITTALWNLDGGRLNLMLDERSADLLFEVPIHVVQYAELMHLFARDLGVKPGWFTYCLADGHIYDYEMKDCILQQKYFKVLVSICDNINTATNEFAEEIQKTAVDCADWHNKFTDKEDEWITGDEVLDLARKALVVTPTFSVSGSSKFFEVKVEDCELKNYTDIGKIEFGRVY